MILRQSIIMISNSRVRPVDPSRSGKQPSKNGSTRKLVGIFSPRRFAVELIVRKNAIVEMRRGGFILRGNYEKTEAIPDKALLAMSVSRPSVESGMYFATLPSQTNV